MPYWPQYLQQDLGQPSQAESYAFYPQLIATATFVMYSPMCIHRTGAGKGRYVVAMQKNKHHGSFGPLAGGLHSHHDWGQIASYERCQVLLKTHAFAMALSASYISL